MTIECLSEDEGFESGTSCSTVLSSNPLSHHSSSQLKCLVDAECMNTTDILNIESLYRESSAMI